MVDLPSDKGRGAGGSAGAESVRRLILEFSNRKSTRDIKDWLARKSLFHTLGVTRSEVVHSSFLAWLLDPNERHGLGPYSLQKFFEALALLLAEGNLTAKDSLLPTWLRDAAVLGITRFRDITVAAEAPITRENLAKGRLDLLLKGRISARDQDRPFRVIIENKIRAAEHREQTVAYAEWARSNQAAPSGEPFLDVFVFLTPLASSELLALEEPECASKAFIQLNYQYLLDYVIEPCMRRVTDAESLLLLQHYVRNLSHPPVGEDEQRGPLVMAISSVEKDLIRAFFETNKTLLELVAEVISQDDSSTAEAVEFASSIEAATRAATKDFSLHDIHWGDVSVARDVKKTDVPCLSIREAVRQSAVSPSVFEEMRKNKDGAFLLLKRADEMTENELKYKRYRVEPDAVVTIGGTDYFVWKNWGGAAFDSIVQELQRWFPSLALRKKVG